MRWSINNMPAEGVNKKVVAVLFADIFEYSKHTELYESETHKNLQNVLERAHQLVSKNSGFVSRAHGDSILATFSNSLDAVYCAVEIHAATNRHNFYIVEKHQLKFRIGINFGEVIYDINDQPYGNVVNIAARLEKMADPGDTVISENTFSELDESFPFACCYLGNAKLNNIESPVKTFKVLQHKRIGDRWFDVSKRIFKIEASKAYTFFVASSILVSVSILTLVTALGLFSEFENNYVAIKTSPYYVEPKKVEFDTEQRDKNRLYRYLISIAEDSIVERNYSRAEEYLDKAIEVLPDKSEAYKKKIEMLEIKQKSLVDYQDI